MSSYEIINTGAKANDRSGDPLRVAFAKINNNFSSLQSFNSDITLYAVNLTDTKDPLNSLRNAFNVVNRNFANLKSFCSSLEVIKLGTDPNDSTGDTLKTAFTKINSNFSSLFQLIPNSNVQITVDTLNNVPVISIDDQSLQVSTFGTYGLTNQQVINVGAVPNDGTGDPLRTAFIKINDNFTNLFATTTTFSTANTIGSSPGQIIYSSELSNFNQVQFNIRSTDNNSNSQNITLFAQLNDDSTSVKFSAYGTTFFGNAVCRYDMDVNGSNVRILCDPLVSANLTHTVFSQLLAPT
jgi:hypothetical protein